MVYHREPCLDAKLHLRSLAVSLAQNSRWRTTVTYMGKKKGEPSIALCTE